MRISAAKALGEIADPSAVPALITALMDNEWLVRHLAAEALGKIGDPAAVPALIIVAVVALITTSYKSIFTRVVNYEIAGMQIPSKYNMLTGKVVPIQNYKGKTDLPSIQPTIKGNLGLPSEQADAARLRWALFEEWVGQMPQYKDWQSNPETFKKAMDDFRKFVGGE